MTGDLWLQRRLDDLAADVGRLSRQVKPDGYAGLLLERVRGHVEVLDSAAHPTAAELHAAGATVEEALRTVDARTRSLRQLLGEVNP